MDKSKSASKRNILLLISGLLLAATVVLCFQAGFLIIHRKEKYICRELDEYNLPITKNQIDEEDFNVIEGVLFYPFFQPSAYRNKTAGPYGLYIQVHKANPAVNSEINHIYIKRKQGDIKLEEQDLEFSKLNGFEVLSSKEKLHLNSDGNNRLDLILSVTVTKNQKTIDDNIRFDFAAQKRTYLTGPVN
ncbi:hypothetical protein [Sedimentisphaera salicampi]|uniref:Uncharacterized protein n=1 Tax=Sedimentisphaera salicampi TaxID=1941349 RepID=A0A1W6LMH1_9BACT|nr:hypothetical protein [Sedimentisphaera salicampi]ARN56975.1 hypothetical protein STSP1_01368 [Sedimentisphaera salicampi]